MTDETVADLRVVMRDQRSSNAAFMYFEYEPNSVPIATDDRVVLQSADVYSVEVESFPGV